MSQKWRRDPFSHSCLESLWLGATLRKGLLYKAQTILEQSQVKGPGGTTCYNPWVEDCSEGRAVVNRRKARCGHAESRQQEAWVLKGLVVHDKNRPHSSEDRSRVLQPMSLRSGGSPTSGATCQLQGSLLVGLNSAVQVQWSSLNFCSLLPPEGYLMLH